MDTMTPCLQKSIYQHLDAVEVKEESDVRFITAACSFPSDFPGFTGHFPDNPVLPAIVQLAAVRCTVEKAMNQPLFSRAFDKTKFRGMVKPDEKFDIVVRLQQGQTEWQGSFKLRNARQGTIAGGTFVFATRF